MSNNNGEGHHQPVPQKEKFTMNQLSHDEIVGNIWATRFMLIAMASNLDCLDELEEQVKNLLGLLQEKGLASDEGHQLNKENFPKFFRGVESAHNNFLHIIDWEKRNKRPTEETMTDEPMTDERKRFLIDIFDAGVEFGIYYWANVRDYSPTNSHAYVKGSSEDAPPHGWVGINLYTIEKGLEAIRSGQVKMNKRLLGDTLAADVQNDANEVDAEIADCIIQAAILGEIMYG